MCLLPQQKLWKGFHKGVSRIRPQCVCVCVCLFVEGCLPLGTGADIPLRRLLQRTACILLNAFLLFWKISTCTAVSVADPGGPSSTRPMDPLLCVVYPNPNPNCFRLA